MIPDWNDVGLIPPIRPGEPGHSPDRAPYEVDLMDVIERFATTEERCNILRGFLNFRNALHGIGLTEGFQWLNGSFVVDIEKREGRPPGDIDVVTFCVIPHTETQKTLLDNNHDLFNPESTKDLYSVDAYFMQLEVQFLNWHVEKISYWYSMWAHTKDDNMWKGFLAINLSPEDDQRALELLEELSEDLNEGGM